MGVGWGGRCGGGWWVGVGVGGTFLRDNLDWNHLLDSTLEKILATKMTMLPHRSRVVTEYLQQDDITEMNQPAQSPDCYPIEHMWNELERAINNMDYLPHNLQ